MISNFSFTSIATVTHIILFILELIEQVATVFF